MAKKILAGDMKLIYRRTKSPGKKLRLSIRLLRKTKADSFCRHDSLWEWNIRKNGRCEREVSVRIMEVCENILKRTKNNDLTEQGILESWRKWVANYHCFFYVSKTEQFLLKYHKKCNILRYIYIYLYLICIDLKRRN